MSLFLEPKSFSVSSVLSVANAFVGVRECGLNGNGNDLATEHTEITERGTRGKALAWYSQLGFSLCSLCPLWLRLWSWGQLGLPSRSTATGCPYHPYATSIPPVRGPRTTATRCRVNRRWTPSQLGSAPGSTGGGTRPNLGRSRRPCRGALSAVGRYSPGGLFSQASRLKTQACSAKAEPIGRRGRPGGRVE